MSTKENDRFLESQMVQFEEALNNKEWSKIEPIYRKLEEYGFGEEVVKLSNSMTTDEVEEYKKWDIATNGNMETQML